MSQVEFLGTTDRSGDLGMTEIPLDRVGRISVVDLDITQRGAPRRQERMTEGDDVIYVISGQPIHTGIGNQS
jgi:hypothetical protein